MVVYRTEYLELGLDAEGNLQRLADRRRDRDYLAPGRSAPVLSVGIEGRICCPVRLAVASPSRLELEYDGGVKAVVAVRSEPKYVVLELAELAGPEPEVIAWGPYPTLVRDSVGETVGVVRGDGFALGIQALNVKTLAGWPGEYPNPLYTEQDVDETRFSCEECAAIGTPWGSVLQAYARNRRVGRVAAVEGIDRVAISPCDGPDAAVTGSKIAVFGCPAAEALSVIEAIELGEGIPHPEIDGVWAKVSKEATRSYLISSFSEANLDTVLAFAKRAGFKYVYHDQPFNNWGHFELNQSFFPDGEASLRRCVEKAEREGIGIGVHTLTNFITTNDPYVTPVPDPRLQLVGQSELARDITPDAIEIPVNDPRPFQAQQWLSCCVIDQELVQYEAVSESPPWRLLGCRRGAFGTEPAAHPAGASIGKLWDHSYRVFFPNLKMQDEVADRIAALFNRTGLRQISFDGLEGCRATGHGEYAEVRFVSRCYAAWKHGVLSDASRLLHYNWHIHTRMNWGEPWGAKMREAMSEYRFKNQQYFERNLFPKMLGWFLLRLADQDFEATALDDVEWFLAKAAGFDAGFAVVAAPGVLKGHGQAGKLFDAIGLWESARMSGAFSEEQRAALRETKSEWHLERRDDGGLLLHSAQFHEFSCRPSELQPGQSGGADWPFRNPGPEQALKFRLRVVPPTGGDRGEVHDPAFQLGGRTVTFRVSLGPNQYLEYDGCDVATVYDRNLNALATVKASGSIPRVRRGDQALSFSCRFSGEVRPRVDVRLVTYGEAQRVG